MKQHDQTGIVFIDWNYNVFLATVIIFTISNTQNYKLQSNFNGSNTDGPFTMAYSKLFLSPYGIFLIAQENKYWGKICYYEIVCCVYSLESPHQGDSNEYTQHTIILLKIENISINYRHLRLDLAP